MNVTSNSAAPSSCCVLGSDAAPLTNRAAAWLLIVDDDRDHRDVLAVMLEQIGYVCKKVSSAGEALDGLRNKPMDAVVADLNIAEVSDMQLLAEIRLRYHHLVFLMATGVDDVRLGVNAMRRGADDYLIKPLQLDGVSLSLERAFHNRDRKRELEHYRENLETMVGTRTVRLRSAVRQVEQS